MNSRSQADGQQGRENRYPRNDRNQNRGNNGDGGQNRGERDNINQRQGNQGNRGRNNGNQGNIGHSQGNQSNRGQFHGNQSNIGQSHGNQPNRGHNYRNQSNRGSYEEHHDIREQHLGTQGYMRQNPGYRPNNRFEFYPGPNPQGMGQFQNMRHPNPNYDFYPDPVPYAYNGPQNIQYPRMPVPIYDAISMESFSKPGTPLSRYSNVSRYKDDVQKKKRNRHSSAQRTSQSQTRERFRSVERPENVNNNGKSITAENRSHQVYSLQQSDDQCQLYNPNSLTGNDPGKKEIGMPTCDDIFTFMVKTMDGKGTPKSIRERSKLFPTTVDESDWFRKNKNSFTLIEKNGNISCIFVFNKKATYCISYGKNLCSRTDCPRYHICRNLCSGKCIHGRRCKYSHDCFDEHNKRISDDLGFSNTFSNDEICIILRLSFPHVCTTWSLKGLCENLKCVDLQLCPGYIIGKCGLGETCEKSHDKNTAHNRAILDAFEMTEMNHEVFRWRVFLVPWTRNDPTVPGATAPKGPIMSNLVNEEAEEASGTYICVDHILEECNDKQCKLIHSKNGLPYIWQINVSDRWISLNESEEIEKKFANNEKRFELAYTPYNESTLSIEICFGRYIEARMIIPSSDNDVEVPEARRLSTKSYIHPATLSCYRNEVDTNKFFTQWRWYWKDDYRQWKLFEPDALQYTLEVKFLAEQRSLNFWRMNYRYKYIIDFEDMKQTNMDTNKSRDISRRPIFVSHEDAKGKQFPVCLSAAPLVEIPLPDRWVPWDLAHNFELVTIEKNSEIYTWVSDSFFRALSRTELEIDTIFRMQNHNLWGLYCNRKNTMLANLKRLGKEEHIDQRYLFHGTDSFDAVRGISINNFDMRVSGKNATRFGDGAYFARDAKYSHNYTGIGHERFMFMATVLVGDYTLGDKSYRRPPTKPRSDHELYDSCVNTLDDPSIFIMFDKNQYYPEYLIQYHKMNKGTVAITTNYVADNSHGSVGGQYPATQNHGTVDSVTNSALRSASALTTETNDRARPLQRYLDRYRHAIMSAGAPSRTLSENTTETRESYPRT